jgi:HEAT repeat protein
VSQVDELQACLADLASGNETRAEAALARLPSLGPAILPGLRELLSSDDPDTRWWVARALAEVDHPETPALLVQALNDPDPGVRQCAALALRHRPSPQAVLDLVAMLSEEDRLLALLVADALVAVGKEAVPALLEVMQNGSRASRLEAARALALIGEPSAIPALFEALDDRSALVTYWAEEGLSRMGVGMTFFKP